jgi:hypothetical protein
MTPSSIQLLPATLCSNQTEANNDTYEHKFSGQPRVNVALFGTAAFNSYVERIKLPIGGKRMVLEFQEMPIKEAVEGHDGMDAEEAARERADAEGLVKETKEVIVAFKKLHDEVDKGWANIDRRFLGHVRFSLPSNLVPARTSTSWTTGLRPRRDRQLQD